MTKKNRGYPWKTTNKKLQKVWDKAEKGAKLYREMRAYGDEMKRLNMTTKDLDNYYNEFMVNDLIDTIGYRLARLNRFGGLSPVSVALHSLIVAELVRQNKEASYDGLDNWLANLYALMHDAHETFTADIPTPASRYLDGRYDNCIQNLKYKIDLYLYRRCFPARMIPLRIRTRADTRIKTEDAIATQYEHQWLKEYSSEIHYAHTPHDMNLLIKKLIIMTIPNRQGGLFHYVDDAANASYEWTNPTKVHKIWQDCVRKTDYKLTQIGKKHPDVITD